MAAYTEEQTVELVNTYTAAAEDERDQVVAQAAEQYGKSLASVRAKLVREGVYVAKKPANKGRVSKEDIVNEIETLLDGEGQLEGFDRLTALQLRTLRNLVQNALDAQ